MQKGRAATNYGKIKGISRSTLSERAYEALKERILDQSLEPGVRLNIDRLARDLQISSSPIREALVRLQAEKLVVSELYSGYSVAPYPTVDYLHHLLDYRILVEGYCAGIGASRHSHTITKTMRQLCEKMAATQSIGTRYREYRRFVKADGDFHQLLVDSAENEVMSDTYASLNAIILQSRLYHNRSGGIARADAVIEEHARILNAFENADSQAAVVAVRNHLEGGRVRLLSATANMERAADDEQKEDLDRRK